MFYYPGDRWFRMRAPGGNGPNVDDRIAQHCERRGIAPRIATLIDLIEWRELTYPPMEDCFTTPYTLSISVGSKLTPYSSICYIFNIHQ